MVMGWGSMGRCWGRVEKEGMETGNWELPEAWVGEVCGKEGPAAWFTVANLKQ
jgi:hypothetical protein